MRGQLAPGGDDVDLQDELRSVLQECVEEAEVRGVALVVLPRQVNPPELAVPLASLHGFFKVRSTRKSQSKIDQVGNTSFMLSGGQNLPTLFLQLVAADFC